MLAQANQQPQGVLQLITLREMKRKKETIEFFSGFFFLEFN